MHDLHFLRPFCFLALAPLVILLALWWRQRRSGRNWEAIVDAALLPHLLIGGARERNPWALAAIAVGGVLTVTALAGPTWTKSQQPVFRRESALVVLLDLSRSMDAADLKPNRLQMARFKLRDLLARRKEGDTALVVYAAKPFTVTPLTNDVATIERQLGSLSPDLMPAQGSRADLAITMAQTLMQDAGAVRGDVLLITDGVENTPADALKAATQKLIAAGFHLSLLGVGTADGAPIPRKDGGFFTDAGGAIVIPKLDEGALARLAASGQGIYRRLAVGDTDIQDLTKLFDQGWRAKASSRTVGLKSDQWREAGPWLLLPLLPLAALAFRRGALFALCALFLLPIPRSAHAFDWQGLWQRPDQRGAAALAQQRPTDAAKLFNDPQWRAAAHYRAGDYQASLKDLDGQPGAEANYNRGNALAHLGKYPEALKAYGAALKQRPDLKDATYNRDLVKRWLQQQGAKSQKDQKRQDRGQQNQGRQDGSPDKDKQGQSQSGGKDDQSPGNSSPGDSAQGHEGDKKQGSPKGKDGNAATEKPGKRDAARQDKAQADRAERRAEGDKQPMSQADQAAVPPDVGARDQMQNESEQADAQWLRRIPDDPGGLWRRKFLYQYKREHQSRQEEANPW